MPVGALLKRQDFNVVKTLFDEYDADRDNLLSRSEFIDLTVFSRFEYLPKVHPMRSELNERKEFTIQQWDKMGLDASARMNLGQLLRVFFPHLRKKDTTRVLTKYATHRSPKRRKPGLSDENRKELSELFDHWDKSGKGFLTMDDLDSPMHRSGIGQNTVTKWMREVLGRVPSRLGPADFEALFQGNYLPAAAP